MKTMPFAKLKQWFRRRRRRGPLPENKRAPTLTEANSPAEQSVSDPAAAKPSAKPVSSPPKAPSKKSKPTQTPVSGSSSTRTAASRPLSRQGIPILKPDEDLAAHFRDADGDETPREPPAGSAGDSDRRISPVSPGSRPAAVPLRRSRAGIRLLDSNTDLHDYFLSAPDEEPAKETPERPVPAPAEPRGRSAPADVATDRHGIPRLDDQADLHRLFDAAGDEGEDAQVLGEALHRSLNYDARGLMKQKTGGFYVPRRLSLKEKLRRYPSPQAQLDLHGATAARARERAANFMRTSRADGLFTVRIIVGKGLHSEAGAVLPDVIEDLLVVLKRENLVLSYRWDKGVKRKSGAVIVYLAADFP